VKCLSVAVHADAAATDEEPVSSVSEPATVRAARAARRWRPQPV